ncbi:carbamoyltransferase family protein [Mucilaginibacter agri]|uniref:Carbamoyltransferase n=1 Tax=Mucilaginibacter agri TaxID=2695265 RepID=A0A965ZE78_9SPHI|nr:carbamoyltransferase [Mucilaginibacter agri]NCD68146.1 hypothetical protein [Mucilaginibacter agri]
MYILGISAYYHDSAACLIHNGEIVAAAQEERFSRIKNDEQFPEASIRYCLAEAQIKLSEITYVVFYEKPFQKFERLLETYLAFAPKGFFSFIKAIPVWLKEKIFLKKNMLSALTTLNNEQKFDAEKLLFVPHHTSHAASAFYPSPYQDAVILTADGVGEWVTTAISIGRGNKITTLKEIRFPHSIGLLYSAFTYYLGFKVNSDEYKVMGLAPYGKSVYTDLILQNLVDVKPDGSFRLNMKFFNYCTGLSMTGKSFDKLFGHPVRKSHEEVTQFHMDIAASIQAVCEDIMLKLTTALHQEFGLDNLCMAGGVALNCVVNGKILKQSGFKNIWIQPAAGDAGGALGAALEVYYNYPGRERKITGDKDKMQQALLGPSFAIDEVEQLLLARNLSFEVLDDNNYYKSIAEEIAAGRIVGYFKGRMEFGPRALGARSIIADPRNKAMQSVLNQKIKFRESFRPFAPAILREFLPQYFDLNCESPYMLLVASLKEEFLLRYAKDEFLTGFDKLKASRSVLPATTHVDGSSRIQTVDKDDHPDFYKLINAFYDITGCPMLVNTSFNRMDEPIVCSPKDALECFLHTDIDVVVIESFMLRKQTVTANSAITLDLNNYENTVV